MATMAVTNTSGLVLNVLESGGTGVSPDAVGGNVTRPLPYPFNRNGSLAIGGARTLGVNVRDFTTREVMCQPELPVQDWDNLLQKGWVTLAFATANSVDVQDELIGTL